MRLHVLVTCLVAVPTLPALAQFGNPGFLAPDTRLETPGVPAPNQTNANDVLFAQLVSEGGLAEVTFGELATQRAQEPAVADFGRQMIDDHSVANDELAGIAEQSMIPLPDALNAEHAMMRDQLDALEGAAFDLAYMRGQVVDHQKTVQLLIWEINSGQNAELTRFAAEKLPTILEHLEAARATVQDLAHAQMPTDPASGEP